MAKEAEAVLDRVLNLDLNNTDEVMAQLRSSKFECILLGDILEHLYDPWTLLRNLREVLAPKGVVVASIPNIGHWDTLANLVLRQRWPYRSRGIHDSTHWRFFSRRNVVALFAQSGLRIRTLKRKYRLVEKPSPINVLSPIGCMPGLRRLFTFQFLVVGAVDGGSVASPDPYSLPPDISAISSRP